MQKSFIPILDYEYTEAVLVSFNDVYVWVTSLEDLFGTFDMDKQFIRNLKVDSVQAMTLMQYQRLHELDLPTDIIIKLSEAFKLYKMFMD
jgi:hypothetical protein